MRSRLAMQTTGDPLAIRNELRAHGQRIVHAGVAALLVVVGSAGGGCESKAEQRQPQRCADFHGSLLTVRDADGIVFSRSER